MKKKNIHKKQSCGVEKPSNFWAKRIKIVILRPKREIF